MARILVVLFVCVTLFLCVPGYAESHPLLQEGCPEPVGRIVSVTGGADINGDGTGDMWFPFRLPISAAWAIKVKVENTSTQTLTFKIRMTGTDNAGWRFGYNRRWGVDTTTSVRVAPGGSASADRFYVQPTANNAQANAVVQLLWKPSSSQAECLLASVPFTAFTDYTPPSSQVFIPATNGQPGYPQTVVVNAREFEVTWVAQELQQPASGFKQVTLEYRTNNSIWRKQGVYPANQTRIVFAGDFGNTYCFRTVAEDMVGYKESLPQRPNYDVCVEVRQPNAPVVAEPPPLTQLLTQAQQAGTPGGVDLIVVCYAYGFNAAVNTNNTADGWVCLRGSEMWPVNWARVCRDVYGNNYQAFRIDNSQSGWRCFASG